MVCNLMGGYLDGTSKHEQSLKGGRRSVDKGRLIGVGGYPSLPSLLILLCSKASTTSNQL